MPSHKIAVFEVAILWLLFKDCLCTFNKSLLSWYPVIVLQKEHTLMVCFIMLTKQMTSEMTG